MKISDILVSRIHVPSGNPASAEHLARYINIQHTVRLVLL